MPARRRTRAELQAQTRAALLEAAGRVFVERGFQGASVEAITEAAGYTRGAFYSNFSTKEELFAELLQERAFAHYREMARRSAEHPGAMTPRETGAQLAANFADPEERWLFRLWLELLAHAGRDDGFRRLAAGFWSGTRELTARAVRAAYEETGTQPPADPREIATALIAVDIGLALQHFVDPDAVPLDVYPDLYELLFDPLRGAGPSADGA